MPAPSSTPPCLSSEFGRFARRPVTLKPLVRRPLLPVLILGLLAAGCAGKPVPPTTPTYADQVVVKKAERRMKLMSRGEVFREYRIALGDNPIGHKQREGDERTPEGDYLLDWRNPRSNYYKAIHISYPNAVDRFLARSNGHSPGGMIMIHGLPNHIVSDVVRQEYLGRDWTDGCIALTNQEMDEIWDLVPDGTPIRILP